MFQPFEALTRSSEPSLLRCAGTSELRSWLHSEVDDLHSACKGRVLCATPLARRGGNSTVDIHMIHDVLHVISY